MTRTPLSAIPCTAAALTLAAIVAAGCGAGERLANVGKPPKQSDMSNPARMVSETGGAPVMPQPSGERPDRERNPNSLWTPGSRAFFKDQRASEKGDILTVTVQIDDEAEMENSTDRERSASESFGLSSFFGLSPELVDFLPNSPNAGDLVDANSGSNLEAEGEIDREDEIDLRLAATVTDVMPNGNMVIAGSQEVRVNHENRVLQVTGVIRPEDISSTNEIAHEEIAQARIVYGGQGTISSAQRQRYGQEVYDILAPF